jgi:glycosyltransferase involved in cell wall biosynthesis
LFQRAQAVVLRYRSEAETYWRAYRPVLDSSKIHIIPNGYDGAIADFSPPSVEKCTILYIGTLPPYRYDTLVQAVHQLKTSEPDVAGQLKLLFVGDGMDVLGAETAALGLSDMIEVRGVVPYAEAKRLQSNAHALLLLGLKPGRGYEFCGSKVFNYLQAGRPILGVLPNDETARILRLVGVATIGDIESPAQIVDVLRRVVHAWRQDQLQTLLPERDAVSVYSAQRQTAALVCALEGARPVEPFVPGSAAIPPSLSAVVNDDGWVTA